MTEHTKTFDSRFASATYEDLARIHADSRATYRMRNDALLEMSARRHKLLQDAIDDARASEMSVADKGKLLMEAHQDRGFLRQELARAVNSHAALVSAAEKATAARLFGEAPGGYIGISREAYDELLTALNLARGES